MDVLHAATHIIEAILAFAVLIKLTRYRYRTKLGRQQVFCIFKRQAYFGKTACTTRTAAIEHKRLKVFATQRTDLLLANNPADAVNNITLPAPVRADDAGNTFIKIQHRFVGKAFKAFNF